MLAISISYTFFSRNASQTMLKALKTIICYYCDELLVTESYKAILVFYLTWPMLLCFKCHNIWETLVYKISSSHSIILECHHFPFFCKLTQFKTCKFICLNNCLKTIYQLFLNKSPPYPLLTSIHSKSFGVLILSPFPPMLKKHFPLLFIFAIIFRPFDMLSYN